MGRSTSPTLVCELGLKTTGHYAHRLGKRLEAGRQCYNACLGEIERRRRLMVESKAYQVARKMSRSNMKQIKARPKAFAEVRETLGYREYDLHLWAADIKRGHPVTPRRMGDHLDINTVQKLATRAFCASERVAFGKARKVRFKGPRQLDTLEGKTNKAGIRWRGSGEADDPYRVEWSGLVLVATVDADGPMIDHGLSSPVKYVRLVRRKIRVQDRWYAQLVCAGRPYVKGKNRVGSESDGTVGLDLGPSTVAWVAPGAGKCEGAAGLERFCSDLDDRQDEIRRLQRKGDRQRRANNPECYRSDGTVRRGRRPTARSNRQRRTEAKLAEEKRRQAAHRRSLHGELANRIVVLGDRFAIEKVSYRSFQRNWGRSVGARGPGMFVEVLRRKAESADDAALVEFGTATTKLSQTCLCGRQAKKALSQRRHDCPCGVSAQRDLFSAYLACFVIEVDDTHVLGVGQAAMAWPRSESIVQTAHRTALQAAKADNIVVGSFGMSSRTQSGSSASRTRNAKVGDDVTLPTRQGEGSEEALTATGTP